eukprot:350388-Chlamydomonas_euryale.AAC.9
MLATSWLARLRRADRRGGLEAEGGERGGGVNVVKGGSIAIIRCASDCATSGAIADAAALMSWKN